jgi:hypothetical protein
MSVVRLPRFLGGGPRPDREPAPNWDKETEAMRCVGEWLAQLDNDEARFRVLTYWMWRLKSGEAPNISAWVDTVAEQSAVELSRRAGFREDT